MGAASNGRVLRIALAASVAVHVLIAANVSLRPVRAVPEVRAQRGEIIHLQSPKPTPTPPPKPALQRAQQRSVSVHAVIQRVHLASANHHTGPHAIAPPIEPTGEPFPADTSGPNVAPTSGPVVTVPTPTPKPACSAPDVPAKTIETQSPVVPDDARANGFTGTAKVRVDLDASGNVVGTSIYESAGSMELDRAALQAARESRYAPEERDCKNVPGSYLFNVDFQ